MLTLEYPGLPEFRQVVPDNGGDGFIVDLVHCNPQSGDEGNYPVNIILTDDGTPPQSGFVVINIEVLDGTTQQVAATSLVSPAILSDVSFTLFLSEPLDPGAINPSDCR